jgi:predicted small lipoprotein YifL
MKLLIKTVLTVSALASLASCGLRGDLKRPPPILNEPATEETQRPVDSAALFAGNEINEGTTYYNTLGGEIPKPAPDVDVEEESMGEVSPG